MAAAKIHSSKHLMFYCFMSSVILNILLLLCLFIIVGGAKWKLSWSTRAAEEAEAAASISCSGHGRAYLDGLILDGRPVCECNTCFGGPDCSEFSPGCAADAVSGDPLFLEPFWMQNAANSAVLVAGWHRMSYAFGNDSLISDELERHIRKLHSMVGNAVTGGRFIVFGTGSTQLLNAAVNSLSRLANSSSPTGVMVSIPFYPGYKSQTEMFRSVDYEFLGDTSLWKNTSDIRMNVIEFVTSPNNPDGQLKNPVLRGSLVKTIHDHAYFWPHFTAIPKPADEDLMIFTLSKLTGHAGSRFGWALVKDEAVYQRMLTYTDENSMGVSRDTQLVALKLLKVVLGGREIFDFGYKTMRKRWESLSKVLTVSKRFSIQEIEPQYCNFYQEIRGPSPAYAWLKCERDEDCYAVLRAAGIIGTKGSLFGAENRYVRLSLIKSQDDFDLLMRRIDTLLSEEDGFKTM